MEAINVYELDQKKLKTISKKWTTVVSCLFHIYVMSKIISVTSSTDKLEVSLSANKPREALVQFNRANPLQPVEFVITVQDCKAPAFYYAPLELKLDAQGPHHASTALCAMTVGSLSLNKHLSEVVLLLDVSPSVKECGALRYLSKAVSQVIKHLPENALFNILLFGGANGNQCESLWPKSQLKTKKTEASAKKFVKGVKIADDCVCEGTPAAVALQAAMDLPRTDGYSREAVLFSDGIFNMAPEEFAAVSEVVRGKALRIFCVGYGASAFRLCLRLSSVGHGTYLMTDATETEKQFLAQIPSFVEEVLQPPTVMSKLELKGLTSGPVLDTSPVNACFQNRRVSVFIAFEPGNVPCSGKVALLMGDATVSMDLAQAGVYTVWDHLHPMNPILHQMCAHEFMEELMQGRSVNGERTTRRKAMATAFCIECKWVRNIHRESDIYDSKRPGLVSSRVKGMPEPPGTGGLGGRDSGPLPLGEGGQFAAMPSSGSIKGNPRSRLNQPQMPVGTWPRPQEPPASAPLYDPRAALKAMTDMRAAADANKRSQVNVPVDQLFRSEVEGYAIDIGLARLASNLHVSPQNLSRPLIRSVQKVVSNAVARFDTRFAIAECANVDELRELVHGGIDEVDFRSEKSSSLADVEGVFNGPIPALISACGKVGARSGGMEDRHIVLPNFFSLMKVNTMDSDALFLGVYDGHAGARCAEYCRLQLHVNLVRQHRLLSNWESAMHASFTETNSQYCELASKRVCMDGTTATVLLIEETTITYANVGDGEGFARYKDGRIVPLTTAHKVSDASEIARIRAIEAKDPSKKFLVDLKGGGMAVCDPKGNYVRVSRSIGDPSYDSEVLSSEPSVGALKFQPGDIDFVVIASDGLWDVMKFQDVAGFILGHDGHSHLKMAEMLVDEAIKRESADNVTVIVAFMGLQLSNSNK